MNVKRFCRYMVEYYDRTRGAGHTYTAINGVTPKSIFVGITYVRARALVKDRATPMSVSTIANGGLWGRKAPIVFDNHSLRYIFDMVANDEDREIGALRKAVDEQNEVIESYVEQYAHMSRRFLELRISQEWYAHQYSKVPKWLRWLFGIEDKRRGGW
jgi:hypothetical protein